MNNTSSFTAEISEYATPPSRALSTPSHGSKRDLSVVHRRLTLPNLIMSGKATGGKGKGGRGDKKSTSK